MTGLRAHLHSRPVAGRVHQVPVVLVVEDAVPTAAREAKPELSAVT